MFATDGTNGAVCRACILTLNPRVGCGASRTPENRHSDPSRASGRPRRRGSKFQNVNFAADGFGCSCPLVNAVTVTTPVGCANFGKSSCHYVDSAGLLRVKLVPQDGIFRPLDPYAGDGRVCTPRLSVFTLSSASVRRGDHITQISPSHAHAPPPSPRGGKPTVRAARACVRCDDAPRVGYAPLRPSRSTRCAGGAKTDQNRPFGEQPIHRRDYVLR